MEAQTQKHTLNGGTGGCSAQIFGNRTGQACPACGNDCWAVHYVEQPGGILCLCTCAVCLHCGKLDGRQAPQIVVADRPTETATVSLLDEPGDASAP